MTTVDPDLIGAVVRVRYRLACDRRIKQTVVGALAHNDGHVILVQTGPERPDWTHLTPIDHLNIESITPLPLALADIIGA